MKRSSIYKTVLVFLFFLLALGSNSADKIRIACVGNSITYGAGVEERGRNCYPAQLGAMLGERYEVRNFGRNGATLLRKGDLPYKECNEFREALGFRPHWVFIKLGTNDSKPENRQCLNDFVEDYKDLISSFRQLDADCRIVLLLPVPVFTSDSTGITAAVVRDRILPLIRQAAFENGCEVINLYNLFIESPGLFPDGIHPAGEGATLIARRLSELVRMKSDESFDLQKSLPAGAEIFNYHGFRGFDFNFRGRNAKVVVPWHTAPGHPWIWRARFWGHEPQTEIALLERGFHVAYCDVAELFGNEEALSLWNDFYKLLTGASLSEKSAMEGMSRGGIYIYRWAAAYPERVNAIYADAPVLDFKSWPWAWGKNQGNAIWETFKKDFTFPSDEEALAFRGSPLDFAGKIAGTGIPLLHVVGDADDVVPVSENTKPFEQKIREAGGLIQVIHKPGIGHHPHSLPDPSPIVDFILRASGYRVSQGNFTLPTSPQEQRLKGEPLGRGDQGIVINKKADGFRGIWYMNQPSDDEYVYKYSGGLAVYPANHRPFAIYSRKAGKTFFCFGGTDEANSTLFHNVSYFDHKTRQVANPTTILDKKTQDAHDNPVISMDSDGYLWIFSTSHGTSRPSYISRSKKPYSIEAFEMVEPTETIRGSRVPFNNFSYFQAWYIKGKGFLALFTKYEKNRRVIGFNTSKDGIHWDEWRVIANFGEGHYQVSDCCNGKVGVAFDYHPKGKGLNWRTNLHYLETADFGKTWQTAGGETVHLPVKEIRNPALVCDFESEKLNCYLSDIQLDRKGNPVILVITSRGYQSGPANDPREWRLFSHYGKEWQNSRITTSDNNYDMGSVYLDSGRSWYIIGPSTTGPQAYNTGGEVVMWRSADRGKNWGVMKQLTQNSERNHCYVRRPLLAHSSFYGIWADGHGRKLSESNLYFCDKEGHVFRLPRHASNPMMDPIPCSFEKK